MPKHVLTPSRRPEPLQSFDGSEVSRPLRGRRTSLGGGCAAACRRAGFRRSGFTLLEVLACLLLVVVVLPVTLQAISRSVQGGSSARAWTLATGLAESRLAEVVADGSWSTGDASGGFEESLWGEGSERCEWTLEVNDWLGETAKELRMSVRWTQFGREETVSLVTVVVAENL